MRRRLIRFILDLPLIALRFSLLRLVLLLQSPVASGFFYDMFYKHESFGDLPSASPSM
jgi:hypothetical protein